MSDITYNQLTNLILTSFPQLRPAFDKAYGTAAERIALHEDEPYLKVYWAESNLALDDPGPTIVLEDIFVRYLVTLNADDQQDELVRALQWIEELAQSEDRHVWNAVTVGLAPALLTTYDETLRQIFPYLGERTKQLFQLMFDEYIIAEDVLALFDER